MSVLPHDMKGWIRNEKNYDVIELRFYITIWL
jgi:hypothetical protein